MKTLSINLILVIFLVVGSVYPLMAQTPEQLYQKGLMKEEGEGNLVEAINIYNLIVENQNADQSLQAKALLHVGMCYEKLGKEEALKAYQQLVNNFPGEKQEVAIARTRLNRLIMDNQKTVKKKEEEILKRTLTNKKIWDESDTDLEGAVSPDGKYLSYVDWDTGDLALYEIATGKKRRLTNKGSWEKSPSYCEYSRWFPDGKRIIYLWYNEEEGIAELRTINIDNQEPETLIKDKEMEWAEIYECSRDGKYVLACLDRKNDKGILTLISLNDGSERALRSGYTSGASFSHDQRYVIYDLPQKDDKGNKDIYIMELDTKNETKLIEHPGDDRLVGRVPNGNDILFISDRTGTPDFWRVKVQNGKSLGEAELVKSNKGPCPPINLGFTNNGSFYYGQRRNNINIYETEIDPLTGEIIT
ncbi:MAG: tetratricopeptide repeat protein, partial [Prolixibacteraceae bacterium]|nr:tetratricopeptide repeat protein [Prolixibacteraceae bacterium]